MQQIELKDTEQPLLERPTNQLLNDFGAGRASPGSGSAAALLGLLAAKMINTVCDISSNKPECVESHKEFGFIKNSVIEQIEPRLKQLFELDARDFERVVELRVLRDESTDPAEKAKHSRESSELLEKATDYTFEIADISLRLMRFGITMFEHGWSAIRGDSGVAISSAMASVMSSIFITNLNLKSLKKRKYASENIKKLEELQNRLNELQTKAFSCITAISSESLKSIQLELETEHNI